MKPKYKSSWSWPEQILLRNNTQKYKWWKKKYHWTSSNLKIFVLKMAPSRKWKDNPENERKYLQILGLRRDLYLEYINNSYRLIIQRQKKLKRSKDLTFLQWKYKFTISTYKDAQNQKPLEKWKSKAQWNSISHSLEWILKRQITTSLEHMERNWNYCALLGI